MPADTPSSLVTSDPNAALINSVGRQPQNWQNPGVGMLPVSPPVPLKEEDRYVPVVGSYDGIYASSFLFPQFSLNQLLNRIGYDGVDRMFGMAVVRSQFDLKRNATLKDGIHFESPPRYVDDPLAKQLLVETEWMMNNIRDDYTDQWQDPYAVVFAMEYGMWTGNKFAELDWKMQIGGPYDGYRMLKRVLPKKNQQIAFNVDPTTLAVNAFTSYTPATGYNFYVPPEKGLHFIHNETDGDPHGIGDWWACWKHWYMLDALYTQWGIALERWGGPVLVTKAPAGEPEAQWALERSLDRIRTGSPAVIPDNCSYDLVTCPGDVFEAFERAAEYHGRQIALNVNSNILSTTEGVHGATSAGSSVHGQMGAIGYEAAAERMCNVFDLLIRRFVRYNHGVDACEMAPHMRLCNPETGDILQLAQAFDILIKDGNMPKTSKIIRQKMDLPPIDPDEQKLLDDQAAAEQEAQERLIDAKQSNKVASMSDSELEKGIRCFAQLIYHAKQIENAA